MEQESILQNIVEQKKAKDYIMNLMKLTNKE